VEILKLVIANPGSGAVLFLSVASLVFYFGIMYSNLKHMQESMVTKKDLDLTIANFSAQISETYVRKTECERLIRTSSRLHEA